MRHAGGERLTDIGPARAVAYSILVGTAAVVLALAYAPGGVASHAAVALLVAAGYVTVVGAVGVARHPR